MLPLLLLACDQIVSVTPSQSGCTNFDYSDPAAPVVVWEPYGDGALVTRRNVLLDQSGLSFRPDIAIGQGVMELRERWEEPETDDQFCYDATIYVEDWAGSLEVRWYVGEDEVPYQTLLLDR